MLQMLNARGADPRRHGQRLLRPAALRRATREVSFDEDGRLSAKPLSAAVFAPDAKSHEAAPSQLPATPAPIVTPAASSPVAPTVAANPAAVVERKSSVWPWLAGIAALLAIVAFIAKRRR